MYFYGKGVTKNYIKAKEYYELSSFYNNSDAYLFLGNFYMNGYGVQKDYKLAKKYYELSSQLNNTEALFYLGYYYSVDDIFDFDLTKSIDYLLKCNQIHQEEIYLFNPIIKSYFHDFRFNFYYYRSFNDLGLIHIIYYNDIKKAYEFIKIAGLNEYPFGQNNLGLILQFFYDNIDEAQYFYEKSSKHHFALAEYNLGYIKEKNGEIDESIEIYKKASEDENEPLNFHNKRHYDKLLEISKTFIICFTNLKISEYYFSQSKYDESKKYFNKSFSKLINSSNKFDFRFNINSDEQKQFLYLRLFILNHSLFNLINQPNIIKLSINGQSIQDILTDKIISSHNREVIKESKIVENHFNRDLKQNIIYQQHNSEKENYNKINKNIYIKYENDINQHNIKLDVNDNKVIESPDELFEFAIKNKKYTELFINEMREILNIMKEIIYSNPYNILFGRIHIEKNKVNHSQKVKIENINKFFYEGFGIENI